MKILVVDDEHILRTRLKSVLEQSGLPLSAVFTAENALNAIECIEKEQPQIVITDIRMPIMSGLELATHIHTHYPQIKVILVTGYSDFEYARTAIQNNVFEYLLKPIDSENLIAVILRAQKEIESAEKNERLFKVFKEHFSDNLQSARRQFVENLLFRSGVFQNADDLREAYGFNFKTYRLVSVCCRTAMDAAQLESEYYCTHLVDEYMQEAQPGIITYIFGNLVFMLWNVEKPNPYDDNEALLGFLRDLHAKARRNFLGMLSAGISQASSTLNNIQTLRHQTSECLEYMQENKKQEFLFYEDILNDTIHWEIEPQIETLTACVHAGNTAGALRYFDQMRADIQEKQPDTVYSVFLLIVSKVCLVMREYRSESYALSEEVAFMLSALNTQPDTGIEYLRKWLAQMCTLSLGSAERALQLPRQRRVRVYQHKLRTADRPCGSLPPCGAQRVLHQPPDPRVHRQKFHADLDRQAYAGGQKAAQRNKFKGQRGR